MILQEDFDQIKAGDVVSRLASMMLAYSSKTKHDRRVFFKEYLDEVSGILAKALRTL